MTRTNRIAVLGALVLASVMIVMGLIMAQPAITAASGGDTEWTGIVMTRPTGITGTWVVGGMSFEATHNTQLETEHGPLEVGACARVRYQVGQGANVASTISSQEAYRCGAGGGEHGEHTKVYSYVNALPAGFPITLTGEWVIGNVTYTAVITTHFEQEHGAFAVGQCAGVEYISGANRLALDIETAPAFKCAGGGSVPRAVIHGVLEAFPTSLVGTWTVSGTVYTATAETRFEQEHGPFFAGGCVELRFNPTNNVALEISTQEAWKCGGPRPTEQKFFGVINSISTGTLSGLWVIGGNSFVLTTTTKLEQEHGPLVVGACAGVEYVLSGTDKIATEISSEEMFKCGGGTSTNVAIGRISSFPPDLYGTWVITRSGGLTDTFEADTSTHFEQEHHSFAVGACVKVKYYTQSGVNHALEIGTEEAEHCGGAVPPLPGMNIVFATIDQFPTGTLPVGLWMIGSVQYSATTGTHFVQNHGPFAVGACVKALYRVVSDTNMLHQVETKDAHKCVISGAQVFRSFGVIESFPASKIGAWSIGGITYTAGTTTTFEQEHGFFAVGAFVEVKYIVSGTTRFALSIETHVAPDAGLDNVIGVLQAHDMSDDWSPWVVNGVTYQSDPAINVQTSGPRIAVGQMVRLNVYRGVDGTPYATSVSSIQQVFLPLVFR